MLSRRAVIAGGVAALAAPPILARAQNSTDSAAAAPTILRLERRNIEVNGKTASVYGIRQPNGTFGITTEVGKPFRVRVESGIGQPSLIHWHGLTPPWRQDGVPGISGPPIPAGGSADYDFPLRFGGTFWMHSHQGLQEQRLMAAPLIIHDERDRPDEQEVVVMRADFSFTPSEEIFENLKNSGSIGAMAKTTGGVASTAGMKMAAPMSMGQSWPDLNDVKYDAFLANFRTLADPEIVKVEPGGRVLLRIINSSSMSAFHVGLGALDGELIAVDGFEVEPIRGRTFPVAVAQRLDIRLRLPPGPGAYPVLAQLEGERGQTGIILVAADAPVSKTPSEAETPSPALTLDLERSLRAQKPLAPRKADRVHTLNLTGEMAGYVWSINNVVWNKDTSPLAVAEGERVELVFVNETPMPHPMHLHGHEFQVVEIDDERFPGAVRDTILVTPGRRVVVAFDADNPGGWALHCHLLYHLEAGMFTTIKYV
ncbi:MAG TPA: multicopper oxidase family protein [Roseiarcus sp.]|nr:multicopper oxidase family protein [Roseiarcus sp.]